MTHTSPGQQIPNLWITVTVSLAERRDKCWKKSLSISSSSESGVSTHQPKTRMLQRYITTRLPVPLLVNSLEVDIVHQVPRKMTKPR